MDQAQRGRWWLNRAQLVLFDKRGGRDKGAEQSRLSHDEGEFLGWWRWVGLVWVSACEGEWKSHTHSTHAASPPTRSQLVYIWLNPCLFFLLNRSFWHCRANCCFPLPYLAFCKRLSSCKYWQMSLQRHDYWIKYIHIIWLTFASNTQERGWSSSLPVSVGIWTFPPPFHACTSYVYSVLLLNLFHSGMR